MLAEQTYKKKSTRKKSYYRCYTKIKLCLPIGKKEVPNGPASRLLLNSYAIVP